MDLVFKRRMWCCPWGGCAGVCLSSAVVVL